MRTEGEGRPGPTTDAAPDDRDPVEALADEFIAARRRGETPSLDEYAARCPDRADEIRELFPAIAAMERWKPGPAPSRSRPVRGTTRERLGGYRLIREIGRGGMGVVYEAEQEGLGRRVAVKVLPGAAWADDLPMRRFLREARTAAGLRHGNIVPVFDVGREDDLHYYVMPLIAGVGLDRVIQELRGRKADPPPGPARPPADAFDVARSLIGDKSDRASGRPWRGVAGVGIQVASALAHAHGQGVLHRDIKPANLLVDAEGVVWVTDFGLAKAMAHDDLSRTGDLIGTLRYMAPERFRGESDARGDLYSLGLTLYELATLRPAHEADDRAELLRKIAAAGPARPRDLEPEIPRDLETVILKAIAADPAHRYASAAELAADLGRFVDGRPVLARRASAPERLARWVGRNRVMAALAGTSIALALVAAVFVGLFLNAPPGPPRPPRPGDPAPIDDRDPAWPPPDEFGPGPPPRPGDFPPDRPPPPGRFRPGRPPFPPPPRW